MLCDIVFVIGMHRSGTSALAGSLLRLGAALPDQMLKANEFNIKGYFESEAVVAANDRFLAEMRRHWNDCRPLIQPEGSQRQHAEDECTRLLADIFTPSPIVVLKDPRVSLLAPIWVNAAIKAGMQPRFVIVLRDPVASASSIMRRDGLDEESAVALWLRYVFDAELHSRGHPRTIVQAEAFVRDPVATLNQVGTKLQLRWPTDPEVARDALVEFIDASLLQDSRDMTNPLVDFARDLHMIMADPSQVLSANDATVNRGIDAMRDDFNSMCPDIHERMVFDQLGKAVLRKWENDSAQNDFYEREAHLKQSINGAKAEREAAISALQQTEAEREAVISALKQTKADLAFARRSPGGILGDLLKYRSLTVLSKARIGIPSRMARRFALSAAKRDPNRSLLHPMHAASLAPDLNSGWDTALTASAGHPTCDDTKKALRRSIDAKLQTFLRTNEQVHLPFSDRPKVSVILVLWNQASLTLACLHSIEAEIGFPLEVIIIDNASTDETATLLSRIENATILTQSENLGFLKAVNLGLETARGDHILLLNNDAILRPGALTAAVDTLEAEDDVGAVGGRIILPNGQLQEAGSIIWNDGTCVGYGRGDEPDRGQYMFRRDVDYCSGAFLLVNGNLFRELNGFDEAFAPAYYEETDLCMRLRSAGYRIVFDPNVVIDHFEFGSSENASSALNLQKRNKDIFVQKHAEALKSHLPAGSYQILKARMHKQCTRILHIDDKVPITSHGAGLPRTQEIVRILASNGYFVTYFPSNIESASWQEIRACVPREVEVALGYGRDRLETFLDERIGYYDKIFISRPHNMAMLCSLKVRRPELFSGVRIIYDAEALFAARDRIKADIFENKKGVVKAQKAIVSELKLGYHADHVTTVSPTEALEFSKAVGRKVSILGHSIQPTPTQAPYADRNKILFLGRLIEDDSPNVDSLVWFVDEVLPILGRLLPDHDEITVVGRSSAEKIRKRAQKGLRLLGPVADLRTHFESARVFIAPTRFAAGIPHKVHQAAAMGVPVVTTSLLASQLGWRSGESLLAADTAKDFATAVASLYRNEILWNNLRDSALSRIKSDCDPTRFRDTLLHALEGDKS